ncbi:MAG: GNAT family N-acetyltransferase [Polyangia bacterium]
MPPRPTVRLVACTENDYPLFAQLFAHLETGDEPPPRERFVADLLPESRVLVATGPDGRDEPAGYLYSQVLDGVGYVRQIVLSPVHRGRGLARAALLLLADELRAVGCTRWCLNVRPDNTPAVALYTSLGMRREYGSVALRLAWSATDTLPPPEAPHRGELLAPMHDGAIESGFGLLPGQLASARAAGRVLCAVRDADGAAVGVAIFDPHFPGAFPFRARRPALAQPLLAVMRPHARPGDPEVHLVIEADDTLAEHLLRAGAIVKLRFDHYGGALPSTGPAAS